MQSAIMHHSTERTSPAWKLAGISRWSILLTHTGEKLLRTENAARVYVWGDHLEILTTCSPG
jgi:hypothetical protein